MATTEPQKWTATLGSTADVNAIPATTPSGSGRASFSGLFPPVTQLPLDQGGIAPERGDFNALFKYLGEYLFYLMQGGTFSYTTDYDYTAGNLVMHGGSLYLCIAANGPGSAVKYPTDAAYWRRLALMSDMPTIGNGTITVQASGTPIGSFTANQGNNSIVNIPEATDNAFGVVKNDPNGFDLGAIQGWVRLRSGLQIVYGAGLSDTPITFLRAFIRPPAVSAMCPVDLISTPGAYTCVYGRSNTGMTLRVWDPFVGAWAPAAPFTYIAIDSWK